MKICRISIFLVTLAAFFGCSKCQKADTNIPPSGLAGSQNNMATPKKVIQGVVIEAIHQAGFSYIRIKQASGNEEWFAIVSPDIKVGDSIQVTEDVVMQDFHSKALNRTFPKITFGSLVKSE